LFARRINFLLGALSVGGLLLVARLAQIQIGWHGQFDREAYTRTAGSRPVETVRGGIFAHWGTPLAVETPSFGVGVYYAALSDPQWKQAIADLCRVPVSELTRTAEGIVTAVERMEDRVRQRQMEREGRADIRIAERFQYHCVLRDVPAEVAAVLRTEPGRIPTIREGRRELPELRVLEGTARHYPSGSLAPHAVGRMGAMSPQQWEDLLGGERAWTMSDPLPQIGSRYRMDDGIGVLGAEKAFEDVLRGRRGYLLTRLSFGVLKVEKESQATPPAPGLDVHLTLREDFQAAANEALRRAAEDPSLAHLQFTSGSLVILDVRSGAVLAAATYPSYDVATLSEHYPELDADPRKPFVFRPLQAALPTGSVYKIITAIAALEEHAITPETTFDCEMQQVFRAGGSAQVFRCTGIHHRLSLIPAIEKSCNIYFYNTGLAAGGEALARWGRAFGLGMPTGVDLPYERAGQLPVPRHTFGVINLSIGQGDLLCTPLQVANMTAAVANGGRLYTPHFLDYISRADGEVVRRCEPRFTQVPVSKSTLDVVREGMRRAVETGTARDAGLQRFRAAGKTGTAERGEGKPNHAWFAGFAPCENPKVAFAVVSENTPGHGGSHAAPLMALALDPLWDAVEAMP
jgi:penicillin-binding protein 2